jgi:hypothetical protein
MLVEKSFDTGELALSYLEEPSSKPPMVLLHGFDVEQGRLRSHAGRGHRMREQPSFVLQHVSRFLIARHGGRQPTAKQRREPPWDVRSMRWINTHLSVSGRSGKPAAAQPGR